MKGVYLKKGNTKVSVVPYYRVGDLFLTTIATNPSNFLGGKWELFGPGRCLVCVNTSDNDFNTVKKTGGSKYLQSHNHNIWSAAGSKVTLAYGSGGTYNKVGLTYNWATYPDKDADINTTDVNNLVTGNSGNLQPYITCYIWIRTA